MEILQFLRARLKIDQQQLAQMLDGSVRIHRRDAKGQLIDETDRDIQRVRRLIDELQGEIDALERG